MAGERVSIRLPMTLQEFLDYTGWHEIAFPERMAFALEYFQREVPLNYLSRPVEDPKDRNGKSQGPNPWLLPDSTGGRTPINLCLLMQAISFQSPLFVQTIPRGTRLKAFRTIHDGVGRWGNYYTLLHTSPESLALPHDQTAARVYESIHSFPSLASTVADAFVDWAMVRGIDHEYRHGGGRQLFVWNPQLKLRPLAPSGLGSFQPLARGLVPTDRPWIRTP